MFCQMPIKIKNETLIKAVALNTSDLFKFRSQNQASLFLVRNKISYGIELIRMVVPTFLFNQV